MILEFKNYIFASTQVWLGKLIGLIAIKSPFAQRPLYTVPMLPTPMTSFFMTSESKMIVGDFIEIFFHGYGDQVPKLIDLLFDLSFLVRCDHVDLITDMRIHGFWFDFDLFDISITFGVFNTEVVSYFFWTKSKDNFRIFRYFNQKDEVWVPSWLCFYVE